MININGEVYKGNSITISNNKIIIDGKNCTPDSKNINITVHGNIDNLSVDVCDHIKIDGNCNTIKSQSGDVEIGGDVVENVSNMSGDVICNGDIYGNVSTMSGDIN